MILIINKKNDEEILKLLDLLNNTKLLQIFQLSSYEVQTTILKCIVKQSQKISTSNTFEGMDKIIKTSIEILGKLYQINGNNFELDYTSNILLRIINPKDENVVDLLQQIPTQIEKQIIDKINEINNIFTEFEPIHPDAQKYIVPIEGIDLTESIVKNQEEIDKLTARCKEFLSVQGKIKEKQIEVKQIILNDSQTIQKYQLPNQIKIKDEDKSALNDKEEAKLNQNGEKSDEINLEPAKTLLNSEKQQDSSTAAADLTTAQLTKPDPQPAKYTVKKFQQLPNGVNGSVKVNHNEDNDTDDS